MPGASIADPRAFPGCGGRRLASIHRRPACLSAICIFGMPRRGVHQPYRVILIINDVTYPAAAGYLVLPLLKIPAIVPMRRQVPAQPMLPVMVSSRTWF
jgi:hypothetical protein